MAENFIESLNGVENLMGLRSEKLEKFVFTADFFKVSDVSETFFPRVLSLNSSTKRNIYEMAFLIETREKMIDDIDAYENLLEIEKEIKRTGALSKELKAKGGFLNSRRSKKAQEKCFQNKRRAKDFTLDWAGKNQVSFTGEELGRVELKKK